MDRSLTHHGIKGQRWGVRRFQNSDGSLTAEGKKRYLQGEGGLSEAGQKALTDNHGRLNDAGMAYYESEGYGLKRREFDDTVYSRVSGSGYFTPTEVATGENIKSVASRLKNNAEHLVSEYANAQKDAEAAVKEVAHLKEAQLEAQQYMRDVLGSDDRYNSEDEKYVAWEAAYDCCERYVGNTPSGKKVDAYEARVAKWWDDAKQETERLVADKRDVVIGTDASNEGGSDAYGKGTYTYKDVVYSTLVDSASSVVFSYMSRKGVWEPVLFDDNPGVNEFADQILAEYRRNAH